VIKKNNTAVIIVNWNGRRLLDDCLTSLNKQSYQNFKIVFVDNGSVDGSVKYVQDKFILSEQNYIKRLFPITDSRQNLPVLPSACQKKFTNTPYLCTFFDGALNETEKF